MVRRPRRIAVVAVVVAVASGLAVWTLQPDANAESTLPIAEASVDDVVFSVGGVGRVVPAEGSEPTATGGSTGTAISLNASGVFPRTSGQLARFLVKRGKLVAAGQAVAILDDGGAAASNLALAQIELETALIELQQRRTSDPATGVRPAREELAAGVAAVSSARQHLARLLGSGRRADISAARLDVRRAEADLENLLGGSPAARAEAIRIAESNVRAAQARLDRILAPPSAADVALAEAELKRAEADLALLSRPRPVRPEALAAANAAVAAARDKLAQERGQQEPDFVAISTAQAELSRAVAELAALQNPAQALAEEIAAAEKAVDAARAKLAKLLAPPDAADVTAARLELERAKAELRARRAGPTRAAGAAARQAVETARARLAQLLGPQRAADVTAARLEVRRAEADLAVLNARGRPGSQADIALAHLKVDAARARLAAARHAKGLLTVRAPSAGVVASLLAARGAPVDPLTPIAAVTDLKNIAVSVQLSEFDAASVRRGLEAVVSVDALGGKEFGGEVLFAGLAGNDNGGVVTFPVRVGVDHARGLLPGMNVSVEIIVAQRENVLQLPLDAITTDEEDNNTVTVIDANGKTSTRTVTLGLANNQVVEITKGLKEGERVVLPAAEEGGGEEE